WQARHDWLARLRFAGSSLARFVPPLFIAYAIMIAAWPWASLDPFNPLRAIFQFAHFNYLIHTLAFGQTYEMGEVPRWYVPLYLAIKLPLLVWAGVLTALVFTAWSWRARDEVCTRRIGGIVLLIFMVVFPVLCHVAARGPAFTGMRHFMF